MTDIKRVLTAEGLPKCPHSPRWCDACTDRAWGLLVRAYKTLNWGSARLSGHGIVGDMREFFSELEAKDAAEAQRQGTI